MSKKLFGNYRNPDLALLLLRVGLGAVFLAHGLMKVQNLDGTSMFLESLGLPPFFGPILASIEFLGGMALLVGAFPRLASLLLAIDMAFAIYLVRRI